MDKGALDFNESAAPIKPLKKHSQIVSYINTIWEDKDENVYSNSNPLGSSQNQQLMPNKILKK